MGRKRTSSYRVAGSEERKLVATFGQPTAFDSILPFTQVKAVGRGKISVPKVCCSRGENVSIMDVVMSPQEDTARAITGFLDSLKQARLASAEPKNSRSIEENTDSLADIFNAASKWPPFSDMPASYQTALQRLIIGRREHLEKEQAISQAFAPEVFDTARKMRESYDLFYGITSDYGALATVVAISISSMLFSAREIAYRKGDKPDDAMDAVVDFVSNLDYGIFASDWIFIAQALLHFSI